MNQKFSIIFFILHFSCHSQSGYSNLKNQKTLRDTTGSKSNSWEFDKIVGQTIYFFNGKKFKTNLYDVKYVGQLQTRVKDPYLILSGKNCKDCDQNLSIYIHSPSDGPMKNEKNQKRYTYPGKEYDYLGKKLLFESRMFYGNCLNEKLPSVIWIQKQINKQKVFEENIFIVKIVDDVLQEKTVDLSSIKRELLDNCIELPGIEITSEP